MPAWKTKLKDGTIQWRFRVRGVPVPPLGKKITLIGTPKINTKAAALAAERDAIQIAQGRIVATPEPSPEPEPAKPSSGPTLREGMEAHLARMRKRNRSERSIHTFEYELTRHLAAYLDRPITELTGSVLADLHDRIKARTKKRAGSNPRNKKGSSQANRTILHVSAAWNALNKRLEGKLGAWNPARAVDRDQLHPSRRLIEREELPGYAARVATMSNPIKRDGLMFALYTGLRNEDVRTVRLADVDWTKATLAVPDPKGGEARAFMIPLSPSALAILERRRKSNARDLGKPDQLRADGGWAFPAINGNGKPTAIKDLRQQFHGEDGHGRFPAEDLHTLRRTWISIAHEEGVSELDQHVLSNHSFGAHNVNATYIAQHIDHLAECAKRIDAGITRRIAGKVSKSERESAG